MLNVSATGNKVAPETTKTSRKADKATVAKAQQTSDNAPSPTTGTRAPVAGGFAIRKNVPMPASRNSGGGVAKYPWATMEAGDMFFVPNAKIETFYTLTASARKKYGKTFKAARLTEDGVEGVGVWCL